MLVSLSKAQQQLKLPGDNYNYPSTTIKITHFVVGKIDVFLWLSRW